ncbi:hypothetical protein PAXINDRAFT_27103, partial [Paxillus involutus ATCC 200175]
WISGHNGVEGNEKADEEAKKAAEGTRHSSPARRLPTFLRRGALPLSASALKQEQKTVSNEHWKRMWAKSSRHQHLNKTDPKMLSGSF